MDTKPPIGRPLTAPDGKPREHYASVDASPAEAEILDTLRGDKPRGKFLRDAALALNPPRDGEEA